MTSLSTGVQTLLGRDLTAAENDQLISFQRLHNIDDDDPLVVVLSLLGINTMLMKEVPETLRKASVAAVVMHEQTLREQSSLIAKELILTISQGINNAARAQSTWKDRFVEYALVGVIAMVLGAGGGWIVAKSTYSTQTKEPVEQQKQNNLKK